MGLLKRRFLVLIFKLYEVGWICFMAAARSIIISVWKLRETRRWINTETSHEKLEKLKDSVMNRDIAQFQKLMRELTKSRSVDLAVFTLQFEENNILDAILRIDDSNVADQFYDVLKSSITDLTFYDLIKSSQLPEYVGGNSDLLYRMLDDSEYIFTGVTTLCSVRDHHQKSILHRATEENDSLFIAIIKRLQTSAGCNITADFILIMLLHNIGTNYLVSLEGVSHTVSHAIPVVCYMIFYHAQGFLILRLLSQIDKKGRTVFETATKKPRHFELLEELIDSICDWSTEGILDSTYSCLRRELIRCKYYVRGLTLFAVSLTVMHNIAKQVEMEQTHARLMRSTIDITVAMTLLQYDMIPKSLSVIAFIIGRLMVHIMYIPERGMQSIILILFDVIMHFVIILFWKWRSRILLQTMVFTAVTGRFFMIGACPEVKLHVLRKLSAGPNCLLYEETFKRLKYLRNGYRYLSSTVGDTKQCRQIKEELKRLSIQSESNCQIITDLTQVHVISLAVKKDRIDSNDEIRCIENMTFKMGYKHFGTMDIGLASDFEDMLKGTLINSRHQNPDAVLIFLMSHGTEEYLLGSDHRDRIALSKLMKTIIENTDPNVEKRVFIQACRSNGLIDYPLPEDGDPVADFSMVQKPELSLKHSIDDGQNIYVHTATGPTDIAFQNTFIWAVCHQLSSTSQLFINMHTASVTAGRLCTEYFSKPHLYCSPVQTVTREIRVPERCFQS